MTALQTTEIRSIVDAVLAKIEAFLCDLIRFPSLSGKEVEVMDYAARRLATFAEIDRIPLSNALRDDADYANPLPNLFYEGRSNLRVRLPGFTGGRSLLLNTHLDVVPASEGQPHPFEPLVKDGIVWGRGACDAKGQAAVIFGVFAVLREMGVRLHGDLLAHLVVEEEVGGNGSLAMIRRGETADACIVLEPTDAQILSSVRGAVWFRVICTGKAGHSGRAGDTVSALKLAVRVIEVLERYHERLLKSSKGIPLFDQFANPMPLTFGKLSAGNWPSTAPAQATIEGVLGFLPNKTRFQVMEEMREAIVNEGDDWLREHFALEFMYRHDAHVLDPGHPLVSVLQTACRESGGSGEIGAMTASCDSWFYNNQLQMPTVVFGPGSLQFAHSNEEHIELEDLAAATAALVRFVLLWCGGEVRR
jgi:acetylornithine deacetylase